MRHFALEFISGHVTQPGVTFTPLVMNGQDSLTVRDLKNPKLYSMSSASLSGTCILRLRSPQLHDNVDGLRLFTPAGAYNFKAFNPYLPQTLIPGMIMIADAQGATGVGQIDTHSLLIGYDDPVLGPTNMMTLREVQRYSSGTILSQEEVFVSAATGDYFSFGSLLSMFPTNRIKFKKYYALVSIFNSGNNFAIGLRGGQGLPFRYLVPGNTQASNGNIQETAFFTGLPCIPVIYGGDFNQVQVDTLNTSTGGTVATTFIFVELQDGFDPEQLPRVWE